jgi:pSer/pThr/pTyr-binding forkhead associated (FHA) protein
MVAPTLRGYIVRDQSENGLFINGQRVDGEQLLGQGDVLSIGEHRLRFEADSAEMDAPARNIASAQTTGSLAQGPRAPLSAPIARAQLLATLEVMTNGPLKGTLFRIERAVAHVGRAEHNEVRLRDTSVSGSHATLTRRSEGWVLLDLGSTNGTYVDGERVSGERRLSGATELRFGDMKLVFRPIAGSAPEDDSTRAVVGVRNRPA